MATFGEKVTALRAAKGSRLAFSKKVKTTYSLVAGVEGDTASIPSDKLDLWIQELGIPSEERRDFIKAAKRQRILLNLDDDGEMREMFQELLGDFRARNREAARLLAAILAECGERAPQKLKEAVALFQATVKLPWED